MASEKNARKGNRKGRQRAVLIAAVLALIVVIILIVGVTAFLKKYSSSTEQTDYASYYSLNQDDEMFVVFDNEKMEQKGIVQDDELYVNYQIVHKYLNKRFYWDSTEQVLRYVTPDGMINTTTDTASYLLGKTSETADHVIAITRDGEMYLSMSFVKAYTDIHYEYYKNPNRVVISDQWDDVTYQSIKKKTQIRQKGGVKSPILAEVKKGDLVTVLETTGSWSKVCSQDGFIGYVKSNTVGSDQDVLYDHNFTEPVFSHISRDARINLAWHQVTNQSANANVADVLGKTKGVNVISPTWFYLNDNQGGIASLCNQAYVTYCHQQGVEVWGLVSNLENQDVDDTSVFSVTSSRDNLVNNLVAEAIKYDLDGINLDFELLPAEAADGYLEFIRELSIKCKNNDLVLSVDDYVPASYNAYYDRAEQAVFADYVVVMAYDEHYNGSDEGSVASIGYVKKGIADTLEEVPAEQIILGIPFYTRVWELTPVDAANPTDDEQANERGYTISSEAVSMSEVDARVAANGVNLEWQDDCGQYYAEYQLDGKTYKIWVEDQKSITEKLGVMTDNNLAGAAFWKLGYEKNTIWDTISEIMKK